jgi:uncharacterized protein (UPF0303 family)
MEYLTLPLDGIMEFGPGNSDSSSSLTREAAFEQLLRLAASYGSQQSLASLAADGARAKARKNPIAADIELRAYQIFLQRGSAHGNDLDDWLTAERQVLAGLKKDSLRVALAFGLHK